MSISKEPCTCPLLDNVSTVDIDDNGSFKYILVKLKCGHNNHESYLVVGHNRHQSHTDIINEVNEKTKPVVGEAVGGGMIDHDPDKKTIHIHGTSEKYGTGNHATAARMLEDAYPGYTVTVSD
ncbi:14 kDa phosphohistidine phosphatase-like [Hyposmocoma kahamanoa]|uniref:14 kDa phosphohistidine phosphatase-like n=1 Tax=Hyposmocoma kahamanoa TaxID=1477025 RepID=UPI000E6D8431|nr:14 kDa phosphohistidine phosphatase-like [Hyposmocoma kahamanoa]